MYSKMNRVIPCLLATIILVAGMVSCSNAYEAKAISGSTIYSLDSTTDGTMTKSVFWNGSALGANLAGIASSSNYLFVTDNSNSSARLHVFSTITNQYLNSIDLSGGGVLRAGAVSVDGNGNVYVVDVKAKGTESSPEYAIISARNWGLNESYTAAFDTVALEGSVLQADVAGYGNTGAAVLYRTSLVGGSKAQSVNSGLDVTFAANSGDRPVAIAVDTTSNKSFIASSVAIQNDGESTLGWIYSPGWASAIALDMRPQDIAFGYDVETNTRYLGIVGLLPGDGIQPQGLAAWRIALTEAGEAGDITQYNINVLDTDTIHKCAFSFDGNGFWVADSGGKSAYLLNTSSWSLTSSVLLDDQLLDIVAVVPEPSSLASLLVFAIGAVAGFKKRK